MFQFGGLGASIGGDKPPKSPRGDGTEYAICRVSTLGTSFK